MNTVALFGLVLAGRRFGGKTLTKRQVRFNARQLPNRVLGQCLWAVEAVRVPLAGGRLPGRRGKQENRNGNKGQAHENLHKCIRGQS